ncbi:MAG: nickel/cobalt transporter [Kiloniellaceae bacterium]
MNLRVALRRLFAAACLCLGLALGLAGGEAGAQTALVAPGGNPPAAAAESGSFWQRSLTGLHDIQRDLHRRLAAAVRGLQEGGIAAAAFLMGISLLYGVFHAVGPGHGKAVISAYLLANESAVRRGVLLAFLASVLQGLSAILLVGVLAILLDMAGVKVRDSVGYLETASYGLVALVGAWLLASLLRRGQRHGHHGNHHHHHQDHAHGPGCGHDHLPDPARLAAATAADGRGLAGVVSKAAGIVLAVGIRPCSGAVLVLLFALAHGVFLAGVAATFAMSFGTAVTVATLAVLTLYSKRLALAAVGANGRWVEAAYRGLGLLGAGLLLLLGAALFWASLGASPPL